MQSFAYFLTLVLSLICLVSLDRKHKIAWFWNAKVTGFCLIVTLIFFLAWDITGIVLGVFSTNQAWVTGLYVVTPDLPIEEFLFLTLLGYLTVLLWRWQCIRTS